MGTRVGERNGRERRVRSRWEPVRLDRSGILARRRRHEVSLGLDCVPRRTFCHCSRILQFPAFVPALHYSHLCHLPSTSPATARYSFLAYLSCAVPVPCVSCLCSPPIVRLVDGCAHCRRSGRLGRRHSGGRHRVGPALLRCGRTAVAGHADFLFASFPAGPCTLSSLPALCLRRAQLPCTTRCVYSRPRRMRYCWRRPCPLLSLSRLLAFHEYIFSLHFTRSLPI